MSVKRISVLLVVLLVSLGLGAAPAGRADAAPVAQGTNLLNSSGFEAPFGGAGTDPSWARWHEEDCDRDAPNYDFVCRPDWSGESNPTLVHTGGQSQHIGVYYTPWHAGVMQTVSAAAGSRVRPSSAHLSATSRPLTLPLPSTALANDASGTLIANSPLALINGQLKCRLPLRIAAIGGSFFTGMFQVTANTLSRDPSLAVIIATEPGFNRR